VSEERASSLKPPFSTSSSRLYIFCRERIGEIGENLTCEKVYTLQLHATVNISVYRVEVKNKNFIVPISFSAIKARSEMLLVEQFVIIALLTMMSNVESLVAFPPKRRCAQGVFGKGNSASERSRRDILQTFMSTLILWPTVKKSCVAYEPDPDPVKESLYLISRVQEATVQQERFVRKASDQSTLKNKMKLTLLLIEKNYKLVDQLTYCSRFIPSDSLVIATEAGNEATEELQSAIDYVRSDLNSGPLGDDQKEFITNALVNTREKLFIYLDFMPQEKLEGARKRIEDENKLNIEEFDGDEDAGVYNPVMLPWKNR